MVSLQVSVKTFTALLFTTTLCDSLPTSKDGNLTSLQEQVKKLDASLQELKSHSQAQEQKYSAVLSSVLSQLTQTTEELSRSKNVSEELQEEVERMKEEMVEVKHSYNESLFKLEMVSSKVILLQEELQNCSLSKSGSIDHGLSQLNRTQTEVLVSLANIVGEMNATGYIHLPGSKGPWLHKDIGFEAVLQNKNTVPARGIIVFDKVEYNEGNGYNTATGYFTAPVSGTYLFWTNIVFTSAKDTTFLFTIETDNTVHVEAYGMAKERNGVASATSIIFLKEGERTSIHSSKEVEIHVSGSSVGAVLIK